MNPGELRHTLPRPAGAAGQRLWADGVFFFKTVSKGSVSSTLITLKCFQNTSTDAIIGRIWNKRRWGGGGGLQMACDGGGAPSSQQP